MRFQTTLLTASLLCLVACGGKNDPAPTPAPAPVVATQFVYADPATGDYRLVRNAQSTGTHLVLDLVGPAGASTRGVAFLLNADPAKVTWGNVTSTGNSLVESEAFTLSTGVRNLQAKRNGTTGDLQVGAFQKGVAAAAVVPTATTVLARVALDLTATGQAKGTPISLSSAAGKALLLPADPTTNPKSITVALGTLTLQ